MGIDLFEGNNGCAVPQKSAICDALARFLPEDPGKMGALVDEALWELIQGTLQRR